MVDQELGHHGPHPECHGSRVSLHQALSPFDAFLIKAWHLDKIISCRFEKIIYSTLKALSYGIEFYPRENVLRCRDPPFQVVKYMYTFVEL